MWQYLVQDDGRGEEIVDPDLVNEIHERLAHLTSENAVRILDQSYENKKQDKNKKL